MGTEIPVKFNGCELICNVDAVGALESLSYEGVDVTDLLDGLYVRLGGVYCNASRVIDLLIVKACNQPKEPA